MASLSENRTSGHVLAGSQLLGTRFQNLIKLTALDSLNSYQLLQPITLICIDSEQASTHLFPHHPAPPAMTTLKEQLETLTNNYTACDVRDLFPNL